MTRIKNVNTFLDFDKFDLGTEVNACGDIATHVTRVTQKIITLMVHDRPI